MTGPVTTVYYCPLPTPRTVRRGLRSGRYLFTECGLERLCSRCGDYWPADTQFFCSNRSHSSGLSGYCKSCMREAVKRCHQRTPKSLAKSLEIHT